MTQKDNSPYHKESDLVLPNIAALSEIRLADEGMLREAGAGYTFL